MFLVNKNCDICERLCKFRKENIKKFPHGFNGAVPSFGEINSPILIVGLAPGLKGANITGRPFTNDYAGDFLYPILIENNLATGEYKTTCKDDFKLKNIRIANAVRCVPQENKPTPEEINNCNQFLKTEINEMKNLECILTLGKIAHQSTIKALGKTTRDFKFKHKEIHKIPYQNKYIFVINSYHTSKNNTLTGVLTKEMFNDIIKTIKIFGNIS